MLRASFRPLFFRISKFGLRICGFAALGISRQRDQGNELWMGEPGRFCLSVSGDRSERVFGSGEPRARLGGLFLADDPQHFVNRG